MKNLLPYSFFLSAILVISWGCEKEIPPTLPNESPMFGLTGTIDGEQFLLEAGNDDYFMFTRLQQDSNGVLAMGGLLIRDTSSMRSGFYLNFRDPDDPSSGNSTPMDSALAAGAHPLYHYTGEKPHEHLHEFALTMHDSSMVSSQIWDLGNGDFSTQNNVVVVYDDRQQLQYPVELITQTQSGCNDAVTHYIDLAQDGGCLARFTYSQSNVHSLNCLSQVISGTVNNVDWLLDGLSYANGLNPTIVNLSPGNHEICATFSFSDGCFHTVCREVSIDANGLATSLSCQNDFDFIRNDVMVYDSLQFGRAELVYYDDLGRAYTTYYTQSPGELTVLENWPYEADAWGRKTRAVRFSYSGELRTKDGNSIQVDELIGVMAIATPE